jgi:hypothetical protein
MAMRERTLAFGEPATMRSVQTDMHDVSLSSNDLVERPHADAAVCAVYRSRPLQRRVRRHQRLPVNIVEVSTKHSSFPDGSAT